MSGDDEELSSLLSPLREPLAQPSAEEERTLRDRVLPQLHASVSLLPLERRRAQRVRRMQTFALASTGLALAAVALLAVRGAIEAPSASTSSRQAWLEVDPESLASDASLIDASGQTRALPGGAIEASTLRELRPGAREARVRTDEGAALRIAAGSRVGVRTERGKARLQLLDGEVDCSVPKLGQKSFAIETPDARVEVHGTRFSVRVRDGAEARTCVRVQEGIVTVHHRVHRAKGREEDVRLGAGDQFGCEREATAAPSASRKPARTVQRRRGPSVAEEQAQEPSGTLAEENRLLSEALTAERENDRERARQLFERLLDRYPSSPLARDAASGLERTR